MTINICLGNITIDCKDDFKLRNFYANLLNWETYTIGVYPVLRSPTGLIFLFNKTDFKYIKPTWPEEIDQQQKQMHFDFHVDDLPSAVIYAKSLGATLAKIQYDKNNYITMFDPEGHPFCLCKNKIL